MSLTSNIGRSSAIPSIIGKDERFNGIVDIHNQVAGSVPFTIHGASGQTANIIEAKNYAGTVLFSLDASGSVTWLGDEYITDQLTVSGNATISGTLGVTGATTLSATLAVSGDTTLQDTETQYLDVVRDLTLRNGYLRSASLSGLHILPAGNTITIVGDATTTSQTLNTNDDMLVTGRLEVDGVFYPDGGITLGTTDLHLNDDISVSFGNTLAAPNAQILWETADANANALIFVMPEGGATDVPVLVLGDTTLLNKDLGLFNGVTAPTFAVVDGTATYASKLTHANVSFGAGVAVTATDYWIGRNADGTNLMQFNVPTGASYEWSVNDVLKATLDTNGAFTVKSYINLDTVTPQLTFGTGAYGSIKGSADDGLMIHGGTDGNGNSNIILTSVVSYGKDHDHDTMSTNPTFFGHDTTSPDVSNNLFYSLTHNGTNMVISAGANTGVGTVPVTANNGILIAPSELTSGGTADFALSVTRTLNDAGAAGGTDLFNGFLLNIIPTNVTGWNTLNLMDLQYNTVSAFKVATNGSVTTTGNMSIAGANFLGRVATGAADYNPSALTDDYIIAVDDTAAPRAVTISTEDVATGTTTIPRIFIIKDESGACGVNNITVSLESGGTIDGAATYVMNTSSEAINLYVDGTNAFIY